MKTISQEFMGKIIANQGIYDTAKYRYVANSYDTAKRMPIDYIGTTMAIESAWEEMKVSA